MESKLSVVIVDGNADFAANLEESLKKHHNLEITGTAHDCHQAGDCIAQAQPDVVLLDFALPPGGGMAVISWLKTLPCRPDIILMDFGDMDDVMRDAPALGITYAIYKPFDFDTAAERITSLCKKKHACPPAPAEVPKETKESSLDIKISQMLYALGITSKISGFNYLKDAVKIVKTDPYGLKSSDVYEAVARIYHTTPSCVERSIQYAKTIAARKGTLPDFLHLIPRRRALPTNMELIKALSRILIL